MSDVLPQNGWRATAFESADTPSHSSHKTAIKRILAVQLAAQLINIVSTGVPMALSSQISSENSNIIP